MARTLVFLTLVYGLALGSGCKWCNAPADYCGPAHQEGYPPAGFMDRRGSILGPGSPALENDQAEMRDREPTLAPIPEAPPVNNPAPAPPLP